MKKTSGYSIKEASTIILRHYAAWYKRGMEKNDWRQLGVFFLRSPAGVGKTEVVYQMAKMIAEGQTGFDVPAIPHAELPIQLFFNAAMDPESIAGTPAPTIVEIQKHGQDKPEKFRGLTMHYREELLKGLAGGPGALLFLDEVGRDAPHMRAAQLKLLSPEKTLAGLDCRHFYTLMAGNTSDDNHRTDDIAGDAAFASRIIALDIVPSTQEWADWMYSKNRRCYDQIANFILDNPKMFIGRDDENDSTSPFHCPRAWETAADCLQVYGTADGNDESYGAMNNKFTIAAIRGIVGNNAAGLLVSYFGDNKPLMLSDVLTGNYKIERNRITAPVTPSLVKNIEYHLRRTKLSKEQCDNLCNFLKAAPADIADAINRQTKDILDVNLAMITARGVFAATIKKARTLGA